MSIHGAGNLLRQVSTLEEADVALVRLSSPHQEDPEDILSSWFHGGSLQFPLETHDHLRAPSSTTPVVAMIFLERAALLGDINNSAAVIIGDFGSSDDDLLDMVLGRTQPQGKLPFDLPRSMQAVIASTEDAPFDTAARCTTTATP